MKGSSQTQSFQGRVTAAILLTAVTVLFVGCTLFMIEQHYAESAASTRSNTNLVHALADAEAKALARGDLTTVTQNINAIRYMERVVSGRVSGGAQTFASFDNAHVTGPAARVYRAPLIADGKVWGELRLGIQPHASTLVLSQLLAMGGALFFAATALALFLGRWLAERITGPVARLSETMATVGESGVFSVRVEPHAPDEIGRLTESFNDLMARLHRNDLALRQTLVELTKARDSAQAANIAKSQFLANMSHEIRTPLNGVLAMAQILTRSELAPVQRDRVEVIRQSGETLLALLNDILDVSKIEAGKLELEVAEFDLQDVIETAHTSFRPMAERKGLTFNVQVAEGAQGVRRGDSARLQQILNNFLSNAVKFTAVGDVTLSVLGEGDDGAEGVRIGVRDTGIGIPADKRSLLFKKFSQVDASTTRRYGGTGLGLAICHELCELMGGRVWVESEEGQGSTFFAYLPFPRVADAPQKAAPTTAPEPAAAASDPTPMDTPAEGALRILAAEDNATNQLVLSTIMQIFGVDLTIVGDGREAVEAWRGDVFDLILMDIQMPNMDGVAATRAIRAAEAAEGRARTPIVALSANALTHQVQEYLAAGMDAHVAKPIEIEKLQSVLERVLAGAEAENAAA
ncbi:ATP-binding protein [Caulobacter sp. S45]|uniref:ATP-binding protein n=1 Tax=Caulobacter sp. S45 TaxID=1641861 RepID=UPI0020B1383C|nr:ATP-binding protein [Caulobacter sp. S45]